MNDHFRKFIESTTQDLLITPLWAHHDQKEHIYEYLLTVSDKKQYKFAVCLAFFAWANALGDEESKRRNNPNAPGLLKTGDEAEPTFYLDVRWIAR